MLFAGVLAPGLPMPPLHLLLLLPLPRFALALCCLLAVAFATATVVVAAAAAFALVARMPSAAVGRRGHILRARNFRCSQTASQQAPEA